MNAPKTFSDSIKDVCVEFLNKTIASQSFSTSAAQDFLNGYEQYRATGVTPQKAYLSMRMLYFCSSGLFPHYFRAVYSCFFPSRTSDLIPPRSIDGASLIADNGYLILPRYFNDLQCISHLIEHLDAKSFESGSDANMKTSKVVLDEETCFKSNLLTTILSDHYLMAIVEAYLGSPPLIDLVTAWRLRPLQSNHTQDTLSRDALMFHVDLDRVVFLKLFVYLNDVSDDNGPHSYIPCSHMEHLPVYCREDRRYSDQELREHGLVPATIKGEAGTVIIADTHCLHKGTPPIDGHRDIFQVEFTVSLFGANYSNLILQRFPESTRDQLRPCMP